jgi:hypothetical protein
MGQISWICVVKEARKALGTKTRIILSYGITSSGQVGALAAPLALVFLGMLLLA